MADSKEDSVRKFEDDIARIKSAHNGGDLLSYRDGGDASLGRFVFRAPNRVEWESFSDRLETMKGSKGPLHRTFVQQCFVWPEVSAGAPDIARLNQLFDKRAAFATYMAGEIAEELALGHGTDEGETEKL